MPIEPPVKFFLEHRKQIEEWYDLRRQVARAADGFFATLKDPIEDFAGNLETNVAVWLELIKGERRIALYQEDWKHKEAGTPFVAIGFFWGESALFDGGWSGIYTKADDRLGGLISEPLKKVTSQIYPQDSHERWWPTWKWERPQDERFWADDDHLDKFRRQLIERIQDRWESLNKLVVTEVEKTRQQLNP